MLLRYRFSLLSAVLALALSLGACAPMEDAGTAPQAPVSDTDTAPNETPADDSQASAGVMSRFTATDLEGVEVDQSIFSDYKLTMVNVWATFCTPCINEMPDLGELAAEYSDQGVRIVGLVLDTLDSDGSIDVYKRQPSYRVPCDCSIMSSRPYFSASSKEMTSSVSRTWYSRAPVRGSKRLSRKRIIRRLSPSAAPSVSS